jgi:single-strand DNA-binding protein
MSEITVSGLVATTPRHLVTQDGLPITSFRLAAAGSTVEVGSESTTDWTNWFTVTSFKQLAINTALSISKGDRVTITGILRVRDWDNGERAGTSVEIESITIGHDLNFGHTVFTRTTHMASDGTKTNLDESDAAPVAEPAHSCSCNNCTV